MILSVRVARREDVATDIISVEFEPESAGLLPPFAAGAHIDVHLRSGLVRQYSLCNDPGDTRCYRIAILRDSCSRGGSVQAHEELQVGRIVEISTPRNHFVLVPRAPALLLAGGIGVTPLLAMAWQLAAAGTHFELHYCTRSPERTAFLEELRNCTFANRVHFHFDDGAAVQQLRLDDLLRGVSPDTHLYVCGPSGFIGFVLAMADSINWPADRLHREYFSASPPPATSLETAFEVRVASTGATVTVAVGEPVTQALARCGIQIPVSCEQGICGSCVTRVLAGEPEHRDMYLTEREKARNDQFTPCCSRARTPWLVLDL